MNPNKSHFVDVNTLPSEIDDDMRFGAWLFCCSSHPDARDEGQIPLADEDARESYEQALGVCTRFRRNLLDATDYLTTEGAAYALSSEASPCPPEEVEKRRDSGEILGVPDHGQWLYPAFQFKDDQLSPFMQEAHNRFCEITGNEEPDRWHTLDFFLGRYHRLGGQTIASCLWDEDRAGDIRFIIKNTRI